MRRDNGDRETSIAREISELRQSVKRDIGALAESIKRDLAEMEQRMTIRLGGLLVVAVGVILAGSRYLLVH